MTCEAPGAEGRRVGGWRGGAAAENVVLEFVGAPAGTLRTDVLAAGQGRLGGDRSWGSVSLVIGGATEVSRRQVPQPVTRPREVGCGPHHSPYLGFDGGHFLQQKADASCGGFSCGFPPPQSQEGGGSRIKEAPQGLGL